ncbi:hypothetical protein D3C80_2003220 [compost metagenome]
MADDALLHHQRLVRGARRRVEHAHHQHVEVLEDLLVEASVGVGVMLGKLGDRLAGALQIGIELEGAAVIEENCGHAVRVDVFQAEL